MSIFFQQETFLAYGIDCTGLNGALRVTTRTTGAAPDPDGYLVTVASANNSSYTFQPLPAGDHDVILSNVAGNCVVADANPLPGSPDLLVKVGTVVVNEVGEVIFDIDCPTTGSIQVTVITTGEPQDPDGYVLTVGEETRPVSNTGAELFEGLVPGEDVEVFLNDLAANCTVAEANPQTVTVISDQVLPVEFTVTCFATGSLEVTTITTGGAPPPDGLFLVRAGGVERLIGINDTQLIEGLQVGDQDVLLVHETNNCIIADPNPRTLTIVMDATTPTTFNISCPSPPPPPVLFESDRDGDFEIYAMNPDGTGLVQLTDNAGFDDEDPSWLWDNQQIIFRSNRSGTSDIWTMNVDGSNPVQITDNAADNEDPAFSPDGTKIVYEEEDPDDGTLEIFIANADGSNPVQLTDAGGISEAPSFPRDGSTILFKSDRDGDFDVYTMDPDGSNLVKLTNTNVDDFDPSWSPDGAQIVFSSQRAQPTREDLWIMNRDGSGQTRILFNSVWDWHPVFSTDGTQIIFTSDRDGDYELF